MKPKKAQKAAGSKRKAPFPKDVMPMLATLVDEPVEEEGWVYEIKWDGYRILPTVSISARGYLLFQLLYLSS